MDWDDMRTFLAVARAGRAAAAARQLGVEHSTVSRRLARLENALGAAVFHRTAGGYRLTAEGEQALVAAEDMERNALVLEGRLRETKRPLTGRVRLALLDEFASHWLAPHLPAFHAKHPGLELQVLVGIQPLDLSRGEADLAVRAPRPRQAGLSAVRLARVGMSLYAARARLGGRRLRVDASSRDLELLVYTPAYQRLQSAAWFQPVLQSSRIVMSTNSSHALLAAARAGAGIAVVPHLMATHYVELTAVSDELFSEDMWLATHPEFRKDPKVRAVTDFLRAAAATLR